MSKDKAYITEAEAALRYGYSQSWFHRERWKKTGPDFEKTDTGRVLYPLKATDEWFKRNKLWSE